MVEEIRKRERKKREKRTKGISIEKRLREIDKKLTIGKKSLAPAILKTGWKTHKAFILGMGIMALLGFLLIIGERAGITALVISGEAIIVDPAVTDRLAYNPEVEVIIETNGQNKELAEQVNTTMIRKKEDYGTSLLYDYDELETFEKLNVMTIKITQNGLEKLKTNPLVKTISYDKIFTITLQDSVPLIRADRVIEKNIESETNSICLIDTGVDMDHPELNKTLTGGYDFVNNDSDPQDDNNHGTHIAGIIHRIAPRTKIIPVKVCNANGGCMASHILKGINYCFENRSFYNITVISGSLGDGGEYSEENCPAYFGDSFTILEAVNITAVFASGNSGYRNGINYPSCLKEVIGVGATDKQDIIAAFGNIGTALDILAPGVNINSTIIDGYGILSGTSMSTPHISAAASLLKSANTTLNTTIIRALLRNTGVQIGAYPRINLEAAIESVVPIVPDSTNATNTTNSTNTTSSTNSTNTTCRRVAENIVLLNDKIGCFDIAAPNIIIDCQDYWINNTNESQRYAISINESARNITVKNCRFNGFKTALAISNTEKILLKGLGKSSYNISNTTITIENKNGILSFSEPITADSDNLANDINITETILTVNPLKSQELKKAAQVTFKNITLEYPYEFYDESNVFRLCPTEICTRISYDNGSYTFNASYTTTYKIDEIAQCLDVIKDINLTRGIMAKESCFKIKKDSITINCLGHNITGENRTGSGLDVANTNNVTVKNCKINNFNEALVFENSTDIYLTNNTFTDIKSKLTVNDKKRIYLEDNTLNLDLEIENNLNLTLKGYFKNISLKNIEGENRSLEINYQTPIILERALHLNDAVSLKNISIKVDSDSYPELNRTARLSFVSDIVAQIKNITARYDPLDNGIFIECPNTNCMDLNKDGFKLSYTIAAFTTYSFGEKITANETTITNETTTPLNDTPNNTTDRTNTTASNSTNTTPIINNQSATESADTNIALPGSASGPNPIVQAPQPAALAPEGPDLQELKTMLEAFEQREFRAESEETNLDAEEKEQENNKETTPSGYLLKGGSTFINNIDILLITTLAITLVVAATYYRFYRTTNWMKKKDKDRQQ